MSDAKSPAVGTIGWRDLTVENAEETRDFYQAVVGWRPDPVDMGDYSDFSMFSSESGECVSGICHARGVNADLPPQWLIYIVVEDVAASAATCEAMGGEILSGPKKSGQSHLCVIRDPAGAVCALYQP